MLLSPSQNSTSEMLSCLGRILVKALVNSDSTTVILHSSVCHHPHYNPYPRSGPVLYIFRKLAECIVAASPTQNVVRTKPWTTRYQGRPVNVKHDTCM